MKISVTKEGAIAKAVVVFEKTEWVEAQDKAFAKLGKNVEVPGFRKGHAPLDQVKKHVDVQKMIEEAADSILPKGFQEVVKENPMDVLVRPDVSFDKITLEELQVTYTITIRPEVKLGQYKDIEIKKDQTTVTEEEIKAALEDLRQKCAEVAPKEDGVIENGCVVNFDFEGFVDGVAFDGGKAEKFDLEIGSNRFIPGFESQMVGMKKGDESEVKVTFPTEYTKELAGKDATFKVKIHEVSVKNLPEIDDELALDANIEGVSNLAELKSHIYGDIQGKKQHDSDNKAINELIDKIVSGVEVDVPSTIVDADTEENFNRYKADVEQKGIPFDKYLEITNNTVESLKEQMKKDVEKNIKTMFVLSQIAKENKLEVTDADIDAEIEKMATQYQMEVAKVKELMKDRINDLANHIYSRKITDYIVSVNKLIQQ